MALPVVKESYCGCSLEVGSKIIAWLQIVGGVLMIIAGNKAAVEGGSKSSEHPSAGGGVSSVSQLVSGIVTFILGVVLLMGIQKKCPDHINVWVIFNLIGIVLYIIGAIVSIIAIMVVGDFPIGVIAIIICAIHIALYFYFVVVVSSLCKEIVAPGKIGV